MTALDTKALPEGPERLFLAPECCTDPNEGRLWCEDNVWPVDGECEKSGVEYIRADLASAPRLARRVIKLEEALEWYANPEIYKPHPHGPAFDDRDLSFKARAALKGEGE